MGSQVSLQRPNASTTDLEGDAPPMSHSPSLTTTYSQSQSAKGKNCPPSPLVYTNVSANTLVPRRQPDHLLQEFLTTQVLLLPTLTLILNYHT